MNESVLIYGSGIPGCLTALKLSEAGFKVDVIRTGEESTAPGCLGEQLKNPAFLPDLRQTMEQRGNTGFRELPAAVRINEDYPAFIAVNSEGKKEEYHSIVFAPDWQEPECCEQGAYNLTRAYGKMPGLAGSRGQVVFLLDHGHITHPDIMRDTLLLAGAIREKRTCEVSILLQNVQVTAPEQQELYDNCREQGILFTKYRDEITVINNYGDFTLHGYDEQAGSAFTITKPSVLIIPGKPALSARSMDLAAGLGLRVLAGCYAQPDALWYVPGATNRPGIFTAGAGCGSLCLDAIREDAEAVLTGISLFVGQKTAAGTGRAAVVDTEKCAYCLTCVRVCPYKAAVTNRKEQKAKIVDWVCQGCGICAGECPAGAISLEEKIAV